MKETAFHCNKKVIENGELLNNDANNKYDQ